MRGLRDLGWSFFTVLVVVVQDTPYVTQLRESSVDRRDTIEFTSCLFTLGSQCIDVPAEL